jgi:ATP-dependent helicase/nuclease subunit A
MLTPAQKNAVERTGQDVCVVAGPGSGKTRVLIERFAWLVEQRGVDPARILAITFTEKAATEIKQRLIRRFASRPDLREAIERAWVSTIDGFCARLLRENAIAAGLAPDFMVMEQAEAERLLRESAEESLDALYRERPVEMRRLLEAVDLSTQDDGPDLANSLIAVYETMRVSGIRELPAARGSEDVFETARRLAAAAIGAPGKTDLQRIAHAQLGEWAEQFLELPPEPVTLEHFRLARLEVNLARLAHGPARLAAAELKNIILPRLEARYLEAWNADLFALLRAAAGRMDAIYREKKRAEAALDFSDLEAEAIRLLESDPAVLGETAGRFDEVLMDELQDTNCLQWRLVNLIRRRFFAVGDINQSIYSFRHAEPAVFEEYRNGVLAAAGIVDDLRENHRSTAEILETVSRMLDGQPGIEARPLISARGGPGAVVERLVGRAGPGGEAAEAEAVLVASRIRQLAESREFDYRDIAVLVRTMSAAEPLERAFDRFGIPFLVSGGRMFFEAREIRDLMLLLAALVNPLDDIAVVGVLRSPLAGLGDEDILRGGREGWVAEFEKRFGHLRPSAGFMAPDRLLATALDESGYLAVLSGSRAEANIEKFLAYIRPEPHRHRPLAELLEDLEGLRTIQSEAEAPPSNAGNFVRLMSIHAAKGLEFPVAFVSALHKGPDRSKAVIAFSASAGLGVKWRNPATGKGQSDPAHARIMDELKKKEEAEENRLLYVAMTRAQQRLIITYAEKARGSSNWCKLAESAIPETTPKVFIQPLDYRAAISPVPPPSVRIVDPPALTGQYDSTAAVTSIATFTACPRKYLLSSLTKGENPGKGPGGIAVGLAVHQVLAGEMEGSVEEAELARRFTASEWGQRAARGSRVEREFDVLFYLEDVVLRGQIDLWFEESGELILVDYKTDRDESSAAAHALQLRLYALALSRYAGRLPDRAVLYYVRPDNAVEVSLDPMKLMEAGEAVRNFREAQESRDFPLRPGPQCPRCPFFKNPCEGDSEQG